MNDVVDQFVRNLTAGGLPSVTRLHPLARVSARQARKIRKDSILGGLRAEQRAKVNKWLFDKGMTYQEVAEACGRVLGLKVSRSSVGRYFQAMSRIQTLTSKVPPPALGSFRLRRASARRIGATRSPRSKVAEGAGRGASENVGETEEPVDGNELYQRLMAKVMELAVFEANMPEELRDVKQLCRLMGVVIEARRERNDAMMAAVQRARFESWAAKEVFKFATRRRKAAAVQRWSSCGNQGGKSASVDRQAPNPVQPADGWTRMGNDALPCRYAGANGEKG